MPSRFWSRSVVCIASATSPINASSPRSPIWQPVSDHAFAFLLLLVVERGSRVQRARPFAWRLLDQNKRAHNAEGLPIGLVITPGEAHDITAFPALMQEVNCDPEQLLGDKGYYSDAVEIIDHGGEALIPTKANRKVQYTVDKAIYRLRNRIERFFNRLKNSRRVATRYDKLIESFAAFVILATIRIWIGFVRTT